MGVPRAQQAAWTEAAVARVAVLWAEGLSASEVARRLAQDGLAVVTRNAVIGKVARLGLPPRAASGASDASVRARVRAAKAAARARAREARAAERARERAAVKAAVAQREPKHAAQALEALVVDGRALGVLDLKETHCRFPIGHPGAEDFAFCGRPAPGPGAGQPYCAHHAALCRVAPAPHAPRRRVR